jgi:hypothetical protein
MIISEILRKEGFEQWPGLVDFLASCLDHQDGNVVDGAFKVQRWFSSSSSSSLMLY